MLSCQDVSRLISEAQERNLSLWERMGLRMHLWMCDGCRLMEKQINALRQLLKQGWKSGDLPIEKPLPKEVYERIRKTLKEQQESNPDQDP